MVHGDVLSMHHQYMRYEGVPDRYLSAIARLRAN